MSENLLGMPVTRLAHEPEVAVAAELTPGTAHVSRATGEQVARFRAP